MPRARRWLLAASVMNILGMLTVASALMRLTSVTLMLSVGIGGALLAVSWAIYVASVIYDLRRRRIL